MMRHPPVIIAIDPGKKCGVVIMVMGRPVFVRTVRGDITAHVVGVLRLLQSLQQKIGVAVMVVEAQYFPRDPRKQNPKSIGTLYKRRHVWEILGEVYGVMVEEPVYPATWKTVLGEVDDEDEDGNERDTKAKAKAYCEYHFPGKAKDQEQADALAMAHWRWRK